MCEHRWVQLFNDATDYSGASCIPTKGSAWSGIGSNQEPRRRKAPGLFAFVQPLMRPSR